MATKPVCQSQSQRRASSCVSREIQLSLLACDYSERLNSGAKFQNCSDKHDKSLRVTCKASFFLEGACGEKVWFQAKFPRTTTLNHVQLRACLSSPACRQHHLSQHRFLSTAIPTLEHAHSTAPNSHSALYAIDIQPQSHHRTRV